MTNLLTKEKVKPQEVLISKANAFLSDSSEDEQLSEQESLSHPDQHEDRQSSNDSPNVAQICTPNESIQEKVDELLDQELCS